ncbi:HEPN domain-containing protein [Candidatus Woesearchaeota archaeon]|nr:HEPN domain-containing protein [Candidatus Woesearchaeota archaeon]
MMQTEKKIEWCFRKAEKEGKKHKGLRKVEPNEEKVQEHLEKARRNLKLIDRLIEIKYADWAISAIFYSMYHCLLAVLWKHGYESRNQACTFAVMEKLITDKKIAITLDKLQSIQESNNEHDETVVDMREYYQYGTETEVDQEKLAQLQQQAKEFVVKVSTLLEAKQREE